MKLKTQPDRTLLVELVKLPKPVRRPKANKAEAEAMDKEVVQLVAHMRSSWLQLGRLIQRVIDTQAWRPLGFANMHSWMSTRLGPSLASAFSALRSVRALEGVPEEKLQRIGQRNAHMLTYLPEKERKSDAWLEKAATFPNKEFKDEVENSVQKKTGLAIEEFRTFSVILPKPVYDNLCEAERKIARSLTIDIEAKPGSRILVWEALAQWILETDEEMIKVQTEGA